MNRIMNRILPLAFVLAGACLPAVAQTISTIAGVAPPAYNAEIHYPTSVAMDSAGDIYFADTDNDRIRKVSPEGTITTVAGTGQYGYSGDGGAATSAKIYDPYGVAVDAAGNLYIADTGNHCIRVVDTNGIINTAAGVCGTSGNQIGISGEFDRPYAVVPIGTQGDLYVADTGNKRIVKFTTAKAIGQIPYYAVVAGGGTDNTYYQGVETATTAALGSPQGMAVDSAGYLYFADYGDNVIGVVKTDGTIFAIGSGVAGFKDGEDYVPEFNQPEGVTIDGATGDLYVADTSNSRIRKITHVDISGTTHYFVTSVAGTGTVGFSGDGGAAIEAEFKYPMAMVFDVAGDMYMADGGNQRIRRIGTDGVIATAVGNGTAGFSGDGASSASFSGDNGPAISAQLNTPYATAVDAGGNIYIADRTNNRVRKVAVNGIITTFAGNGTAGSIGDGGAAINAELNDPIGVAADNSGNVYIAEYYGQRIRKIDGNGNISTVAGTGTAGYNGDNIAATTAKISYPIGITVDASGHLYITDNGNERIRKLSGGTITTVAGNGTGGYNGDSISATSAEISDPYDVAIDKTGNMYVADTGNARIRKVAPNGIITTVAGTGTPGYTGDGGPATSAHINQPALMAVDGAGALYFADSSNDVIRRILPNGMISTVVGNSLVGYAGDGGAATSAELNVGIAVSFDALGHLYVSDYYTNRIRKVTGLASDRIFANGFE